MKQLLLIFLAFLTLTTTKAQSLKIPQPSPAQTIKQDFGLGSIEISYSRPSAKGRTVYGDLVPYGDIWRTGANSATTISFSDEVNINGVKIPAGKYGLLTIPGQKEWTLIISKQTNVTSPADYKQDQDLVRVVVQPAVSATPTETFTIQIANIKNTSCDVQLIWEKTIVALPVTTEIDTKVMKQIENTLVKDNRPYFSGAFYYSENNKDLNQAISWYDKAIEQNPKGYWIYYQKARTLLKMGRKQEALIMSQKSMELAREEKDDTYVRHNEKLQKELK
ncbi:MAG: DUF2911 domain-containing protein [Lacibacter sp.]